MAGAQRRQPSNFVMRPMACLDKRHAVRFMAGQPG